MSDPTPPVPSNPGLTCDKRLDDLERLLADGAALTPEARQALEAERLALRIAARAGIHYSLELARRGLQRAAERDPALTKLLESTLAAQQALKKAAAGELEPEPARVSEEVARHFLEIEAVLREARLAAGRDALTAEVPVPPAPPLEEARSPAVRDLGSLPDSQVEQAAADPPGRTISFADLSLEVRLRCCFEVAHEVVAGGRWVQVAAREGGPLAELSARVAQYRLVADRFLGDDLESLIRRHAKEIQKARSIPFYWDADPESPWLCWSPALYAIHCFASDVIGSVLSSTEHDPAQLQTELCRVLSPFRQGFLTGELLYEEDRDLKTLAVPADQAGEQAGEQASAPILLRSWSEILDALNLPSNRRSREAVKKYHDDHGGPIVFPGRGGQPRADKARLLAWWVDVLKKTEEQAQRERDREASTAAQHPYGREGTAAPDLGGHVKHRRSTSTPPAGPLPDDET